MRKKRYAATVSATVFAAASIALTGIAFTSGPAGAGESSPTETATSTSSASASASASATPDGKVTICHATAAVDNPYVVITVDKSSIDETNNQYLNGHGDHTGPVFDPEGGKDQPVWGDIIPPFESDLGAMFAGLNWDKAGQRVWAAGCVFPTPSPSPTPTATPTVTPTPTPTVVPPAVVPPIAAPPVTPTPEPPVVIEPTLDPTTSPTPIVTVPPITPPPAIPTPPTVIDAGGGSGAPGPNKVLLALAAVAAVVAAGSGLTLMKG